MDSIVAKEKMRFSFQDSLKISGEFKKVLNSSGRGGRGQTAEKQLPFGPQQNPAFLLVRSTTPHVRHCLSAAWLFEDELYVSHSIEMGAITQLFDIAKC